MTKKHKCIVCNKSNDGQYKPDLCSVECETIWNKTSDLKHISNYFHELYDGKND